MLGAGFYFPTAFVTRLLVTHALIVLSLLRPKASRRVSPVRKVGLITKGSRALSLKPSSVRSIPKCRE
jgi:hypothetical protein